jgi:hypothetical protein
VRALVAVVLLMASCQRCAKAPSTPDARLADAGRWERSTELRAALFNTFPETRGAMIRRGRASLVREVEGITDPAQALRDVMAKAGFTATDGGVVSGVKGQLHLGLTGIEQGVPEYAVWVNLDEDAIARVFAAPTSLSTSEMALLFPKQPGQRVLKETFFLELEYQTQSEARASFLTHQLLELLHRSSLWHFRGPAPWSLDGGLPDGGPAAFMPTQFTAVIGNDDERSTLTMARDGVSVGLRYELPTLR